MVKPPPELADEAKHTGEELLAIRRSVWRREAVSTRDVIDAGMHAADFLCKLSSRGEKERNRDVLTWLQQTRRSMRAMLREYWTDVLEQRPALYAAEIEPVSNPVR